MKGAFPHTMWVENERQHLTISKLKQTHTHTHSNAVERKMKNENFLLLTIKNGELTGLSFSSHCVRFNQFLSSYFKEAIAT